MTRPVYLLRSDIRRVHDRPTDSIILQYTGRRVAFDGYLAGYPDGTFFAIPLAEVELPEDVVELAIEGGIRPDALPDAKPLRVAVANALAAEALVEAPELLGDIAVPRAEWHPTDQRQLEREHRIAETKVADLARLMVNDLRLRMVGMRRPTFEAPAFEPILPPALPFPSPMLEPVPELDPLPVIEEEEEEVEIEQDAFTPTSKVVERAKAAVKEAREAELPQRLPKDARRRLQKMGPGMYLAWGETIEVRADLCGAMTDARSMSRKDRETTVIDYDGEWPVVVRRYGQGGRTVYTVESALKRHAAAA